MMYVTLIMIRSILYISFMRSIISQICDYCDLPFLMLKEDYFKLRDETKKKSK